MGSHPKQLIEELSEDLLRVFTEARLIDRYDVYQHLMSYWTDIMQDDVYMITNEYLNLLEQETEASKKVKDAQKC